MKAFLMYPERDFDMEQPLPWNADDLVQDLELNTLFKAMARDDEFLFKVAKTALLSSLTEVDTIRYRQAVFKDCLANARVVGEIYRITVEAVDRERKTFRFGMNQPAAILRRSVEVLQIFVTLLKRLRNIAEREIEHVTSQGFSRLFSMLQSELDEDYFATIDRHLRELKFREGVLISARLGSGNKGTDYVLRKLPRERRGWLARLLSRGPPSYTFHIHPRDESGARALAEMSSRGLNLVANALAQSTDHILDFFKMLRTELAFYMGCLNLYQTLEGKAAPTCLPEPAPAGERRLDCRGLYDACLSLHVAQKVVGNEVEAGGDDLVIVTGANQGGKSTFLRAIGLAQLMLQCGMFVPAERFAGNVCSGLFTHYKRQEDAAMDSGKFEEELKRMSAIADRIDCHAMVLFNESFASTNEREGSEIARQIVSALLDKRIKVFFITHFYELAYAFYADDKRNTLFLRANRQADGSRTFKLTVAEPLATSYGQDLYERIFAADERGMPH